MREKQKIKYYPSKNKKTETYIDGDTFVAKHFYDAKDAYVREFISITNNVTKIKHITQNGVTSKLEHFVDGKRDGQEIKYFISKADGTIKSTKFYSAGKLDGENITYNDKGSIIKHEVYALGKSVLKYLRKDGKICDVTILDQEGIKNLSQIEFDKLQTFLTQK